MKTIQGRLLDLQVLKVRKSKVILSLCFVKCELVCKSAFYEGLNKNRKISDSIEEMIAANTGKTEKGIVCLLCGSSLSDFSKVKVHFRDLHYNVGVKYACPKCQRVYKNRNSFGVHMSNKHRDMKGLNLDLCVIRD